jgi:NADH-quinone oxidoreductase subunit I
MGMINKTYHGLKGLLSGMGLTLGYFLKPSSVITQQYPENRETLKLPPRTRSNIKLVRDNETGGYVCGACGLCVKACPNGSLEVTRGKDPLTKKIMLEKFVYHFERCTLCGSCIDACHSEALTMGQEFEAATFNKAELTRILNSDAIAARQAAAAAGAAVPASSNETSKPAQAAPATPGESPKAA